MINRMRALCALIATLGPIGFMPAPGTVASLIAMIAVFYSKHLLSNQSYFLVTIGCIVASLLIVEQTLRLFNTDQDLRCIVIDEYVGVMTLCIFLPYQWQWYLVGFLLFRFLDISKWAGIRFVEYLPRAWGIVLDDVAAALLSALILNFFIYGQRLIL